MLKNHEKLTLTKNVIFLPVLPFFVILDFAHENSNNFTLILAVKKIGFLQFFIKSPISMMSQFEFTFVVKNLLE